MNIERLPGNPIITQGLDASLGDNINDPSLIRVPDWVPDPLGRYCLYFAHHNGRFISSVWPMPTLYRGRAAPRSSARGPVFQPVCELRDPAVFVEDGRGYLLYATAGEQAIAIASIQGWPAPGK